MQAPLFGAPQRARALPVARIALPVPVDSLFDYDVPEELAEHARPGHRALVSFGGRRLTGVIVERLEPRDAPEVRGKPRAALERIVDRTPVVSAQMLSLLTSAAHDLLCPVGLALSHALPPGSSPRIAESVQLTQQGRVALERGLVSGSARAALAALEHGPLGPAVLTRRAGTRSDLVSTLARDGLLERLLVERSPSVREATERVVALAEETDVEKACATVLARAPRQAELLRRIASGGETPSRDIGAPALLRALRDRGLVRLWERKAVRRLLGPPVERVRELPLTPEQAAALGTITAAIEGGSHSTFLLHGVTGSGKTEVYLRAIATALARRRRALILVPEITLTHQILARLRARFGDDLALLHSSLRPSERLAQWQRLRRGEVSIAVGARSALFAPISDLGVIVLDEEHDSAYKNEEGFRYHARDLAIRRAKLAGCPVVLGSATPSLETRYASDTGDVQRLVLARRIGGRPLPSVQIVDLKVERARAPRGRKLILAAPLRRALRETLAAGHQSILFLNRRGFSTQIYCFDCGFAERCKDCDVALVYHATEGRLRCHYCDYCKAPEVVCGGCGAPDTALLGLGTERVEEEVRILFPDARLARLDRDTAARRGYTEAVLRGLQERKVDVLIGTQMVAKGHDFPGVQLVGVVAADLGLHMPDFRAAERTFQVLTQVAGRAGRAGTPGRVIVQTYLPDHYAIRPVVDHDYEAFYARELEHRAEVGYPPLAKLCQIVISGTDEQQTHAAAETLAQSARAASQRARDHQRDPPVAILGPSPAPLSRLRGRYRFQLLLKGGESAAHDRVVRVVASAATGLPAGIRAAVDAAPGSML